MGQEASTADIQFKSPGSSSNIDHDSLGMLAFFGDGLAISSQRLHIQPNSVFGHRDGFFKRLALGHTSRKGWYRDGVASFLGIRVQNDGVAVLAHGLASHLQSNACNSSTVNAACSRMVSNVFILMVTVAWMGSVTRPGFFGCLSIA